MSIQVKSTLSDQGRVLEHVVAQDLTHHYLSLILELVNLIVQLLYWWMCILTVPRHRGYVTPNGMETIVSWTIHRYIHMYGPRDYGDKCMENGTLPMHSFLPQQVEKQPFSTNDSHDTEKKHCIII